LYSGQARAIGWLDNDPELEPLGPLALTGWQRLGRAVEAQALEDANRWNDPCAVVMNMEEVVEASRVSLWVTDYAAVCALRADAREKGTPPPIMLSAAAVVTGPDETLLLHQRAGASSTYPGALHTFGGGYVPKRERRPDAEDLSLTDTIRREFLEETRISLTEEKAHRLWVTEPATGFAQCVYLGLRASSRKASGRWEGETVVVATERDLVELLRDTRRWVPTGHLHVVAWLMVGAPGFAALTEGRAKALADEIVAGGALDGWAGPWPAHTPGAARHQDVPAGGATAEHADFVALSSRSAVELGCDVAGPPTPELLDAVKTAATVAPKHRDFDGLVVDLRGEVRTDEVFRATIGLRSSFLSWLRGRGNAPASNVPLVLIGGAVELDAVRRWSARHGGPALWFSLGIELVETSEAGVPWPAVRAAVDRLEPHPVVQMSTRIRAGRGSRTTSS
jgi:hypothetical protein